MSKDFTRAPIKRRTVLQAGFAIGAAQITSPFVVKSLADEPVKIGLDNPLTGTYAALGKNELIGAQLALSQINAKGGILGRPVQLLVEESTSGDAGTAVEKARKLIDRDQVNFLVGNINSALAAAIANVSYEKGVFHVVPGGHTDPITGTNCHWNVFRVCNTTQMEANAVAGSLSKNAGKKWYYITPDYAFGHTLQAGLEKAAASLGGSKVGGDLTPLGTTDFSSYLIKAQAASPDVIIFLVAGDDAVNALKQAVQFGLDKKTHIAGAQQELSKCCSACRRRRASALGFSNGTGSSRTWRTSNSSLPTFARRAAVMCRRRGPGSVMPAFGPVRSRPSRRNRWTPSKWRRRCRASNCRPRSR
jgi:branched-chain amino acid transport system substrate-binding protein